MKQSSVGFKEYRGYGQLYLGLWIWSAIAHVDRFEEVVRHPNCSSVDDPRHPIQLPYPTDCRKYYTCKNGYAYAMLCANGLHWSQKTYRCDFPAIAKCINAPHNPIEDASDLTAFSAGGAGDSLSNAELIVYKKDPIDCNKFYKCMPIRCPPYLYWNSVFERCDSPQNGMCETSPDASWTQPFEDNAIPTAATPPSLQLNIFKPVSSQVDESNLNALCSTPGIEYVRHPNDCHKFIQCSGTAKVHTCTKDLYWNSAIMACDRYCK